jgi:hypothetical protein
MLRRLVPLFAVAAGMLVAASASAQTILFAQLTNAAENPPAVPTLQNGQPRPASFGEAVFILNAAQTELSVDVTVFNIDFTGTQSPDPNDNLTNAHIHAGPTVTPSTNGGVVWGFIGTPFNNTTPNEGVTTPFATGVGGRFTGVWNAPEGNNTTLAAQLTHILNNRSYINFHTVQFGGGEVRGNLAIVPEPSAIALLCGGGLMALRRRRASS